MDENYKNHNEMNIFVLNRIVLFFFTIVFYCHNIEIKAQESSPHFLTEGAVHEYGDGIDHLQMLTDLFIFEGHQQRIKWMHKAG